jgi:hypothetical protein
LCLRDRRDARELDSVFLLKQERERAVAEVEQAMGQVRMSAPLF